ncbi:3-hydroxyisobutyryl-CoA hydrolase [Coemansia sp. Benny D115]|nr:3-hydroxyisobutyryl-CoA hydrolase [Coemansia sp. Benny D115]
MLSSTATSEGDRHVLTINNLTGRSIVLNRPKALNSLTHPMIKSIQRHLLEYEQSDLCDVVVMRSNSTKAFCAGGDVVQVSQQWKAGDRRGAVTFFQDEYQTNHLIASFKKPLVALLNGYTMGGGVGLSVHAPFRVATESAVFAMPETKIGFFPDVGATFFLPRLDGQTGTYLGLTGSWLRGRDLLYAGIATHYVPSERLPMLEKRLQELGTKDHSVVNEAIEEFAAQPEDGAQMEYSLGDVRGSIDRCFGFNNVEAILEALRQETENKEWAEKTLQTLGQMSPSSLKITLEQLRMGARLNIQQAFALELHLAEGRLFSHDMHEGIDALLVRKAKEGAQWDPSTVAAVDMNALHKEYFQMQPAVDAEDPSAAHGANQRMNPAIRFKTDAAFTEYPHKFGLPTEREIMDVVSGDNPQAGDFGMDRSQVLSFFDRMYSSKVGVKQKVSWVLDRTTRMGKNSEVLRLIK